MKGNHVVLVAAFATLAALSAGAQIEWKFNVDGQFDGWVNTSQIDEWAVAGGELKVGFPNQSTNDPYMTVTVSPPGFDATTLHYVRIDQRAVGHNGDAVLGGEIHAFPGSYGSGFFRKPWNFYPNIGSSVIILDMTTGSGSNPPENQWSGVGTITEWRIDNTTDLLTNWHPDGYIYYDTITVTNNPTDAGPYTWLFDGSGSGTWVVPKHDFNGHPHADTQLTVASGVATVQPTTSGDWLAMANYGVAIDANTYRWLVMDVAVGTTAPRTDFKVRCHWVADGGELGETDRKRVYSTLRSNAGTNRYAFNLSSTTGQPSGHTGTWGGAVHGLILEFGEGDTDLTSVVVDNVQLLAGAPPIINFIEDAVVDDGEYYGANPYLLTGAGGVTWTLDSPSPKPTGFNFYPLSSGAIEWTANVFDSPVFVTVRAENAFGSDTESWTIYVPNHEPTGITSDPVDIEVDDRAPSGTLVCTFDAIDPDPNDTADFSLIDTADGRFTLDSEDDSKLIIADASAINYADGSYEIVVRVQDSAGQFFIEIFEITVLDTTAPTPVISGSTTLTNAPRTLTVDFGEPVVGFASGDIAVTNGSAGTPSGGTNGVYSVVVTGVGVSTVSVSIPENGVTDVVGHPNNATAEAFEFPFDGVAPTVSAPTLQGTPQANALSVTYHVAFSEPVTDVDPTDFFVTTGSGDTIVVAPSVGSAVADNGTGLDDLWIVTVNTGEMEGTVRLDVVDDESIKDSATNSLATGSTGGTVHTVDTIHPTVVSVNVSGSPTAIDTLVDFEVTFSEAVKNVNEADFTPSWNATPAPTTNPSVDSVTGSDSVWTVTVDVGVFEGTLGLDVSGGNDVADLANNTLNGVGGSGNVHTVDSVHPDCLSITHEHGSDPVNIDTLVFKVAFSEDVLNFDATDLDYSAAAPGVIHPNPPTIVPSGQPHEYVLTFTDISGDGAFCFTISSGSDITDVPGNPLDTGSIPAGQVVTIDNTPPVVTFSTPTAANPGYGSVTSKVNRLGVVTFTITYSGEQNISLTLADIQFHKDGTVSGWDPLVLNVTGPHTREVVVSGLKGDGNIWLTIDPETSSDVAGNLDIGPSPSPPMEVDNTGPGVIIDGPDLAYTNIGPVHYHITFTNGAYFNLQYGTTLTLNRGPFTDAEVLVFDGATATPMVTVYDCEGNYWLGITVAAAAARDEIGNTSLQAVGNTFTVDNVAPSCVSVTHSYVGPTSADDIEFEVTFTEPVTKFNDANDVRVGHYNPPYNSSHTGLTFVDSGDHQHYTVIVNGLTATAVGNPLYDYQGMLEIEVKHESDIEDLAGNQLADSGPAMLSTPPVEIDKRAASVSSILPATTGPTNQDSMTFTVTFTADVDNFDATDLTVPTTGSVTYNEPGITVVPGTGPEDVYTVTVPNIAGDGTLRLGISTTNDIVRHDTGLPLSGTLTSQAVSFDNTGPSATAITPAAVPVPTSQDSLVFTVVFDQRAANFDSAADLVFTENGSVSHTGATVVDKGAGTEYTVTVTGIDGDGTMQLAVSLTSGVTDVLGNPIVASVTSVAVEFQQDLDGPNATTINAVTPALTKGGDVVFAVAFDEPVVGFDNSADLMITASGVTYDTTQVLVVDSGDQAHFTVTFSLVAGTGTLQMRVRTGTGITDLFGNPFEVSVAGQIVSVDNTAPAISFSQPSPDSTVDGPVTYTVSFEDPHLDASTINLTGADILLTNLSGKAAPTVQVSGTGSTRTVTISDLRDSTLGLGLIAIEITRPGTAYDLVGNSTSVSGQSAPFTVEAYEPFPLVWWPVGAALAGAGVWAVRRRKRRL